LFEKRKRGEKMGEKKKRRKSNRKKEERERKKGVAGAGLTMVVIALALCVFAQSALASQISVEPECQIVTKDETFKVNITVYPEESEVFAASYTLYFNNTLLNATSQVNGSFLSQDGVGTFKVQNETNNTKGEVKYGECRKNVDYGVTNPGVLATITFEALADGFCELRLSDLDGVILADPNYTAIPTDVNNGSVRIGLCGDVAPPYGKITWTGDVMELAYYSLGAPGHTIKNDWAGDIAPPYGKITWTGDVMELAYYSLGAPGHELNCHCSA
jgi:hypothetical protein